MRSLSDVWTLMLFFSNLREGVYITNESGRILDANPAFLDMFGVRSLDELETHTAASLLVDPARRQEQMRILSADGAVREYELEIRRPDGKTRTVLDTAYQVRDEASGETLFHGILVDITERKALERQLREASIRDPLTGCYNRRFLQERMGELDERGGTLGVIVVDVDHFKQANDTHGHDFGDRLLVLISRFLSREVRAEDFVVRTGGDEFAVVLPGADLATTRGVAERLQAAGRNTAPAAFTLGWAVRQTGEKVEDTLKRADHSLIQVRVDERSLRSRANVRPA